MTIEAQRLELQNRILDSSFLLPRLTGNGAPVEIPGVRGWVSPYSDAPFNRIGFTEAAALDETLERLCAFFGSRGAGFTVILGPDEIREGASARLSRYGFTPSRPHHIMGMHLKPFPLACQHDAGVAIRRISLDELDSIMPFITKAYGYASVELTRFTNAMRKTPGLIPAYYLASRGDGGETVGFATAVLIEDRNTLLLRGSGVLPCERGKGIYKALTQRRISDAFEAKVADIIVQADKDTSYKRLLKLGFRDVCAIEWHQWRPGSH